MALKARENGQSQYADELTKLASDWLDEAEPSAGNPVPQLEVAPRPPAQQKQQPQLDPDKDKE
jgi:hypothetical protein